MPSFDEFCNQPFQASCIYFDAKCQLANVNMCVRSLYPSIRLSVYPGIHFNRVILSGIQYVHIFRSKIP